MATNLRKTLTSLSPIATPYPAGTSKGSATKAFELTDLNMTVLDFLEHCEDADENPVEVVKSYSAVIRS